MKSGNVTKTAGFVVLMAIAGQAASQDVAGNIAAQLAALPKGTAGASLQVPSGGGSGWGALGVGLYGQTLDGGSGGGSDEDFDGSLGLSFGLGNPAKYVGLDVSVSISSISGNNNSSFGEQGSLGLKLHTNLPGLVSFGVGVQSIGRWTNLNPDPGSSSVYAALSKYFPMPGATGLSTTIGIGDNAYSDDGTGAGLFGSAAWYFNPRFSVFGEYTGRVGNLGASFAPFQSLPLSVSAAVVNLADRDQFGGTQFAMTVGYGFGF